MRILTVSDYVIPSLLESIDTGETPPVDLVLACGDLPPEYMTVLAGKTGAPSHSALADHSHTDVNLPRTAGPLR